MQKKYNTVIFDLDGTLLDTLDDLTDSVNAVLANHRIQQYSREQIRSFVGNGILRLMERAVPNGEQNPEFEQIYEEFREYYRVHCMDKTKPYPGIMDLLKQLSEEGCHLAIVSNKADFAVKKLRDHYFKGLVEVAIGERESVRRKPFPDTVYQALQELDADRSEAVYVGDSEVDLQTAANAQMDAVIVTWGFRDRKVLISQGAVPEQLAATTDELSEKLS